jgi:hypothetical protein
MQEQGCLTTTIGRVEGNQERPHNALIDTLNHANGWGFLLPELLGNQREQSKAKQRMRMRMIMILIYIL